MKEYIRGPINYTGSKYRLLKSIVPLFPERVEVFHDVFGGSGTVGMNCGVARVRYNDINNYIGEILSTLREKGESKTLEEIQGLIDEYGLTKTNEEGFKRLREDYNNKPTAMGLLVLSYYSFNFQIRFNNSKKYNSSFGRDCSHFSDKVAIKVRKAIERLESIDLEVTSKDYREYDYGSVGEGDFVYFDPPYSVSKAVYQDGKRGFKGWSVEDDRRLMEICDDLDSRGIRFAMSNMLESKGNINEGLVEWSSRYKVHYLDQKYSGCNYQRDRNKKDIEVLITNY